MSESFVSQLEKGGYFKGLPPEKAAVLKQDFEQQGWMAIFSESHRLYFADAEDLAEGGVGQFIHEAEPFLTAQGIELPDIEDDFGGEGYVLLVGGVPHEIYSAKEFKEGTGDIWGLSAARGFQVVNELLADASSAERVYGINGGNDLLAFFLTPDLYHIIMAQPDVTPQDAPFQVTEESPWFGQPHDK